MQILCLIGLRIVVHCSTVHWLHYYHHLNGGILVCWLHMIWWGFTVTDESIDEQWWGLVLWLLLMILSLSPHGACCCDHKLLLLYCCWYCWEHCEHTKWTALMAQLALLHIEYFWSMHNLPRIAWVTLSWFFLFHFITESLSTLLI